MASLNPADAIPNRTITMDEEVGKAVGDQFLQLAQLSPEDQKFVGKFVESELIHSKQIFRGVMMLSMQSVSHSKHQKILKDPASIASSKLKSQLVIFTNLAIHVISNKGIIFSRSSRMYPLIQLSHFWCDGSLQKDQFTIALSFQALAEFSENCLDFITTHVQAKFLFNTIWTDVNCFLYGHPKELLPSLEVPHRFLKKYEKNLEPISIEKITNSISNAFLSHCLVFKTHPNPTIFEALTNMLKNGERRLDLATVFGLEENLPLPTSVDVKCLMKSLEFPEFIEEIFAENVDIRDDFLMHLGIPLSNNRFIKKVKLRNVGMSHRAAVLIGKTLQNRTIKEPSMLKKIEISSMPVGNSGISAIFEGLQNLNLELEFLNIKSIEMAASGTKSLFKFLSQPRLSENRGLRILKLDGNSLNKAGSVALAKFLERTEALESLSLKSCNLRPKYLLQSILKAGNSLPLSHLNLSGNFIKKKYQDLIIQVIRNSNTLGGWGLSKTSFSKSRLTPFFEEVFKNEQINFRINLSKNNFGPNFGKAIELALLKDGKCKQNKTVKALDLSGNLLGVEGMIYVCNVLKSFVELNYLNLSTNIKHSLFVKKIDAGNAIADLMSKASSIQELVLDGDDKYYLDMALVPVFRQLTSSKTLRILSVRNNRLNQAQYLELEKCLQKNVSIKELDIDQNHATAKSLKILCAGALSSPSLVALNAFDDISRRAKKPKFRSEMRDIMEKLDYTFEKNGRTEFFKKWRSAMVWYGMDGNDDEGYGEQDVSEKKGFLLSLKKKLASEARIDMNDDEKSELDESPTWERPQFGVSLNDLDWIHIDGYDKKIPSVLVFMETFLWKNGAEKIEGLFRLAPDATESAIVKEELNDATFESCSDLNSVANNLKVWFRDLAENDKILSEIPVSRYSEVNSSSDVPKLLNLISEPKRTIFMWVLDLCVHTQLHSELNKMTPANLAIVFAPNLYSYEAVITDPKAGLNASRSIQSFIEYAISYRSTTGAVKRFVVRDEDVEVYDDGKSEVSCSDSGVVAGGSSKEQDDEDIIEESISREQYSFVEAKERVAPRLVKLNSHTYIHDQEDMDFIRILASKKSS